MPEEDPQQQQQNPPTTKSPRNKTESDLAERTRQLEERFEQERQQREDFQRQQLAQVEERLVAEQVERARAQARVQFPSADRELLESYPTQDPEAILSYASKLHEKAQMRMFSANGVPLPPSNQTDAALSTEEAQIRRWQTQIRNPHLRKTMDPIEADQAWQTFFARGWNSHMEARKRAHVGGYVAPGGQG